MNFREFFQLNEDKTYILMKNQSGQYQVIGPKSIQELPTAMQTAKQANRPVGMWTFSITGGELNLPPELEKDKEKILHAHYARLGFDVSEQLPERPEEKQAFGSIIEPSVFDPRYEKRHALWKKYQGHQAFKQMQQQPAGTLSFHGHPLASGMPTPQPKVK